MRRLHELLCGLRRFALVALALVLLWPAAARASALSFLFVQGTTTTHPITGATTTHYFWRVPPGSRWQGQPLAPWLSVGKSANGEFQAVILGLNDHNGAFADELKAVVSGKIDHLRSEVLHAARTLSWGDQFTYFGFHGGTEVGIPDLALADNLPAQARVIVSTLREAGHHTAVLGACHGGEFGPELLKEVRAIAADAGENPALYRVLVGDGPGSMYGLNVLGQPGGLYYRLFGKGAGGNHIFKPLELVDADAVNLAVTTPKPLGWGSPVDWGDWFYRPNLAGHALLGADFASRRVWSATRTASRHAWAAARWAGTKNIARPLFSRSPWAARLGAGAIGGWALGTAVEQGVAGLTGNDDVAAAAGYAAAAYGGYATESVLFGTASGSTALAGALYFLPVAVHLHITGHWINGPLEQAIASGDADAQRLYDEFNWGLPGLGALAYGIKTYYNGAAEGIANLLP